MPIVIKEVIIKTTVERSTPQEAQLPDVQIVDKVKRRVLEELSGMEQIFRGRKYKKDR